MIAPTGSAGPVVRDAPPAAGEDSDQAGVSGPGVRRLLWKGRPQWAPSTAE